MSPHTGNQGGRPELSQRLDRLDHAGRRAEDGVGALPPARHLGRDRIRLRPPMPPWARRTLVSVERRSGEPADLGQQLLQVLVDDRVAIGLARGAGGLWRRGSASARSSTPRARRGSYKMPVSRHCETVRIRLVSCSSGRRHGSLRRGRPGGPNLRVVSARHSKSRVSSVANIPERTSPTIWWGS